MKENAINIAVVIGAILALAVFTIVTDEPKEPVADKIEASECTCPDTELLRNRVTELERQMYQVQMAKRQWKSITEL